MRKTKTDTTAVELRFLVAPALVEAARMAMAPFCLEENSRLGAAAAPSGPARQGRRCAGLTLGELKILLQD